MLETKRLILRRWEESDAENGAVWLAYVDRVCSF